MYIMPGLVNAMRRAVLQSKKTRYRIAKESGVSAPQLCRLVHGQGDLAVSTVESWRNTSIYESQSSRWRKPRKDGEL